MMVFLRQLAGWIVLVVGLGLTIGCVYSLFQQPLSLWLPATLAAIGVSILGAWLINARPGRYS